MNPADIAALVQAFLQLEPLAQRGIAGLIHMLKGNQATAAQNIAQATAIVDAKPAPPTP